MTLLPGFVDPVADSQSVFRAVLDTMAHPGRIRVVADAPAPPPLAPATAALLLTLADADTPVWLSPECEGAREWLVFHCGSPIVLDPAQAAFAVATQLPDLALFDAGSDEAPERSATLIVQVYGLKPPPLPPAPFHKGRGSSRLLLAGPGLREPAPLSVDGLPDDFAERWAANHALSPRGIDLILCAGAALVALPRSLSVAAA